jgi:hypothetical protein
MKEAGMVQQQTYTVDSGEEMTAEQISDRLRFQNYVWNRYHGMSAEQLAHPRVFGPGEGARYEARYLGEYGGEVQSEAAK